MPRRLRGQAPGLASDLVCSGRNRCRMTNRKWSRRHRRAGPCNTSTTDFGARDFPLTVRARSSRWPVFSSEHNSCGYGRSRVDWEHHMPEFGCRLTVNSRLKSNAAVRISRNDLREATPPRTASTRLAHGGDSAGILRMGHGFVCAGWMFAYGNDEIGRRAVHDRRRRAPGFGRGFVRGCGARLPSERTVHALLRFFLLRQLPAADTSGHTRGAPTN